MKKSLLKQAHQIALSKLTLHPEYHNYIHYSFVIQENKIVEWGVNSNKVPPVHYGYQHRIKGDKFGPKSHSEIEAFRKARGLLDLNKKFEMINIRLNKSKELRISKPCSCCHELLMALGCSKFYYSSDIGFLTCV